MNANTIATDMIAAAASAAQAQWASIREVATHEFRILSQRVTSVALAVSSGEMTRKVARLLLKTAQSQLVAVLAMLSTMVMAAAQKIVRAAIGAIKTAVNTAVGFALIG
jgi:hypothetical protein